MLKQFFEFKETDRKWPVPVLAGLSVGIPMLAGYFTGMLQGGKLASLAGLVILYSHSVRIANRLTILMACSFGIMVSFAVGSLFSFNPLVAPLVLGLYAFIVHVGLYYLKMTRPPGNFFFIMIASVAICLPFKLDVIPQNIGFVGIGTMISFVLALVHGLLTLNSNSNDNQTLVIEKSKYVNLIESATFGSMVGLALLIANLLELENPYWVPTSCAAVMQGISTQHIWQRSIQRIVGTFIGLGLTWLILLLQPSLLMLCLGVIGLQLIVEFLVVRNYGLAVIFITILTIFLAESGNSLTTDPTTLIFARFIDILIGSVIGAFGGWMLYNERLQYKATRQMRRTKILVARRK
ncbi:FUSC family protein [Fibrella aquatica]|uniref:FUSC family protein n=1 Tax=Fibrella aquatica TaxID=3242487 RepID=UPI0035219A94